MSKLLSGCVLVGLALWAMPVTAEEKCVCPTMKAGSVGWCAHCQGGMAFGHPTKCKKLVVALEGAAVDVDKIKCPGCKDAAKASGACCQKTYAHNKAYTSFVAGRIAKGNVPDIAKIQCAACKKAAAGQDAVFCSACNIGFVAGLQYNSKEDYEAAKKANDILSKAIEAVGHCEDCAVVMVTNGKCSHCNVTFKDGELTKS